ncbi:13033_t:CDS:2 [Ambispora gerdemannii]|uniref:13033_t:CDS:1 n=1 Tax=Ambispora gerdemannii TaxID=144530 RepID=A0A9N8ZW03_9GLOM|nr:13033_t:CDS:2 [Ambispora gerdemannii]
MATPLTSTTNPPTSATLTIRLIKNFEYRTVKNVVLQNVNLETTTVGQLKQMIRDKINSTPGLKPFRSVNYDTLKLYTKAHGTKSQNLTINLDHDNDWVLNDDQATLISCGLENETELSFFDLAAYQAYKTHPDVIKWD